ncbi:MAG: DNA mismatch repair endonuclease MutL [Epsilonproteobacteria bacterium]|nr:DNA mismatch repair endonuclease MutL [Campylobacterota bacterium]
MNKIKLLAPEQAAKIAAGEVIERPANIVKELIENSLDAQAKNIELHVKKAGKELIRVVDDGCGMSADDAKLSVVTHATSKITTLDDLEYVASFGFRGEALASVCAVSKLRIKTKLASEKKTALGLQLDYANGVLVNEQEVACSVGTDIAVNDLFYTTPVRKKFLKTDQTELSQLQLIFYAYALVRLDVSFKFFSEDRLVVNAPAVTNLKERAAQLWDHNFATQLLELAIDCEQQVKRPFQFMLRGMITNRHFWRYGKQQLFFFVNNRWVKNAELVKGILKGYENILPAGKYPAGFIFVDVDQGLIDVNVHPKKEEVRFVKPLVVQNALRDAVKKTLEVDVSRQLQPTTNVQPMMPFKQREQSEKLVHESLDQSLIRIPPIKPSKPDFLHEYVAQPQVPKAFLQYRQTEDNFQTSVSAGGDERISTSKMYQSHCAQPIEQEYNIIGQLFNTYILIEKDNQLLVVDQHAAHERVLYERWKGKFEKREGTALLFPHMVNLTSPQLDCVLAEQAFFATHGIELERLGQNTLSIKTCPPDLQKIDLKEFIREVGQFAQEHEELGQEELRKKLHEHVHSHMACKAAVKAGDRLTFDQMKRLLSELEQCPNRHQCIHGRPTIWSLEKAELEKHFRRR